MKEEVKTGADGPVRIDLKAVVGSRLGAKAKFVPNWLIGKLEQLVKQDELNELLEYAYPNRGSNFCRAILEKLEIGIEVVGEQNLPENPRAIFISNHPLGGLDGMALIHFIGNHYGREPLFVVNDLLMAVEPLTDVFLPVNKHGAQSRLAGIGIDKAMAGDRPIIIFPAGLCSRRRDGEVRDLEWRKMFVQKASEYKRDIVPMYFEAQNSADFYQWANRREKLGLKFNIEMVLLPGEMIKARGKNFKIIVGEPISWLNLSHEFKAETRRIRKIVDTLGNNSPKNVE